MYLVLVNVIVDHEKPNSIRPVLHCRAFSSFAHYHQCGPGLVSLMNNKLYSTLASLVQARINCENAKPRNDEWFDKHTDRIEELVKDNMPSGSGFDSGSHIDLENSDGDRLFFTTAFHHMNDSGMYDGWTEHNVIVTPSLQFGFNLKVTGRDRNQIKEYIHETFSLALQTELVTETLSR